MPSQPNGEPTGAKARGEAAEDNSFVSRDTFSNPAVDVLLNTATVEDAQGIERIVAPTTYGFSPAPMEATDEEKQAATDREKLFNQAREKRLNALKGEIKDEDRLLNAPGVGGSDGGTVTADEVEDNKPKAGKKLP